MKTLWIAAVLALAGCNAQQVKDIQPTAIQFGDSVSLAASGHARLALYGDVDYRHDAWEQEDIVPEDKPAYFQKAVANGRNNGDSTHLLAAMRERLTDRFYTVLLFNSGLHDIQIVNGTLRVPLDEYRDNLEKIADIAQAHATYVIWVDTTPVHSDVEGRKSIQAGGEVMYNAVAHQIAREHGFYIIETTDYGQRANNIHFTQKGSEHLGKLIRDCVLTALEYGADTNTCHH